MCRGTIPLHPELTENCNFSTTRARFITPYLETLWYMWLQGPAVGGYYQDAAKRTCPNRVFSLSLHLLSALCDLNPGQVSLVCLHGYIIFFPNLIFLPVWHLRSLARSQAQVHRRDGRTLCSFKRTWCELIHWRMLGGVRQFILKPWKLFQVWFCC